MKEQRVKEHTCKKKSGWCKIGVSFHWELKNGISKKFSGRLEEYLHEICPENIAKKPNSSDPYKWIRLEEIISA